PRAAAYLRSWCPARYQFTMSEREPALLGDRAVGPEPADTQATEPVAVLPNDADTVPVRAATPAPAPSSTPSEKSPEKSADKPAGKRAARTTEPPARPSRREAPAVHVVGFWKRLAAAAIDL